MTDEQINISHRSAVQTLQTYMGLDNTKEGLRACLLAYEAVKAERDKALAACAEMRACIEALQEWEWDMPDHLVSACTVSLSTDCGKDFVPRAIHAAEVAEKAKEFQEVLKADLLADGWCSPEKRRELEDRNRQLEFDHDQWFVSRETCVELRKQVKLLVEALDKIKNDRSSYWCHFAADTLAAVKGQP